jgi:hypothetical protein
MNMCDCQPTRGETKDRRCCKSFDVFHIPDVLLFFVPRRGNRTLLGQVAKTLGRCRKFRSVGEMTTTKSEMSASKRGMKRRRPDRAWTKSKTKANL